MSNPHPIIKNTLVNILYTVFSFVMAYVMTPIIIERLGIEKYGIWVFLGIFSTTGYFSLFELGFQGSAVKYIAEFYSKKDYPKLQSTISATVVFFLAVGLITAILLILFNQFFLNSVFNLSPDAQKIVHVLVNLIACSMLVQFPVIAYSSIIIGLQRYDYLRIIAFLVSLIGNVTIVFFLNAKSGLPLMVYISIVSSVIILLLYYRIFRKLLPGISVSLASITSSNLKQLFEMSSQLVLTKIIGLLFKNTDKILIGIFLTVVAQTDYDIVNKLYLGLLAILSMMNQAILPTTSELHAKANKLGLKKLLTNGTKYSTALVLPTVFFLLIFPKQLISAWVDPHFIYLAPLVQLYVSHIFFTMLVSVGSSMLVGVDRVMEGLKIATWAAIINIGLSIVTVRILGISGLILGTVIAHVLSSLFYSPLFKRIFELPILEFFKKIIVPQLIPSAVVLILMLGLKTTMPAKLEILIAILAATYVIYGLILYRLGFSNEEKMISQNLLRSLKEKIVSRFSLKGN